MTLRRKTIVIIGATLVGLLLILFAVSQGILLKDVAHQGQTTLLYFLCLLLGTGLVFIGVIYVLLDRLVLSPLSRLSATVSSIGRTGVLSARVSATGKDELSNLAGEINRMLGAIEGSHKALQESEEKFKRLVEDMGDGYFVAQGYRLVYANNRSAEMFGYSVPEVINKPVAELLAPNLAEELSELHYKRLRGEIVRHQYEVTLVRNDGKAVDVEFSARRMYYEGRPAVSVVMRDITERKKAEEALRQSEEHYSTLVRSLTEAVFKFKGKVITWCNDRVEEIYGYKKDELIGKNADSLFPEGVSHSQFIQEVSTAINQQGYFRGSGMVKRKDESLVHVEYTISQIPGTEPRELVAVARDITERKRIEDEVATSEAKYRSLVETASAGVVTIDLKGEFVFVNEALCGMVGYSQKELIGSNFADFLYPDDGAQLLDLFAEGLASQNEHPTFEFRTIHRDGHIVWLYSSPVALVHENDTIGFSAIIHDITERKRMEEALRQSEERFRYVLDNSLDMIYSLNLQTRRYEYVSPASGKILGYSPEELIAGGLEKARATIHPDDIQRLDENFIELITSKGNTAPRIEYRVKHKELGYRWVSDSRSAVYDNGNTPVAIVGSLRDVTERNQIEEALRQSEEKLKRYLESSPDLICVIDLKGTILFINKAAERITGYSAEELLGKRFLELPIFTPEYLSKPPQLLEHDQAGRPTEPSELELIRKDGSRVDVEISYLFTGSIIKGGKTEIIGIARDITERKLMEKALRQSEERFRNVLDNSLDMIYSLNLQTGKYEYVSPSSKKLLGYSPQEFLALDSAELISLVHPDDAEELQQNIVDLLTHGENRTLSTEYRIKHKEFDYRWVSDNRSVVYDGGNMPVAIVGSLRDVTDHKQAEQKLKQTMAKLARSNTELERFAYVASHDLQEPLRMVASYTQLLARRYKGKLDSDADEFIGYAVDGATRMQQLINALLDYSRVSTRGKSFEPTDCEDVFSNAVANLKAAIKETDAVVEHDPLPTVMADSSQMVQLFQNLIGNAIKFHSEKKPEVHVGAERNGTECIFSVRDNGIGIDPQYFDRIFVIFQRLHGRGEYPGTGIGLAICKKIIERHKGRIWVESQPGKGATFYFTIPIRREEKP